MFSSVMIAAARLSTPDCISALFLFIAFYFILERPSILCTFLFLAASVFARLDNIILACLLLTFLSFSSKWAKKVSFVQYITMLAALAGIYIGISGIAREYNWELFYYPDFIKYYQPGHPARPSFSLQGYLALFYERTIMAILHTHFSIFLLFVLIMLSSSTPVKFRNLTFELLFCALLIFTVVIRFILFPDLEDRFYIAYYLAILILFMHQYKPGNTIFKTARQAGEL